MASSSLVDQIEETLRLEQELQIPTVDEMEVNERYDIKHQLGEGATATVFYAIQKQMGEKVAVKKINRTNIRIKTGLLREIQIMKQLDHPNIIKLFDVFQTETYLYIVMELARGYPLFDVLVRKPNYNEQDARIIVKQILSALDYIHEKGIAHRDLKPENILFEKYTDDGHVDLLNNKIKLCDFGFANINMNGMSTPIGTLGYKAPELVKKDVHSMAVDCWALGVITYILLCGFPPFFSCAEYHNDVDFIYNTPFWVFFNNESQDLEEAILNGNHDFPEQFWGKISPEAKSFVSSLLQVDPNKRMTAKQGLVHPFIQTSVKQLHPLQTREALNVTRRSLIRSKKHRKSTFAMTDAKLVKKNSTIKDITKPVDALTTGWLEFKGIENLSNWTLRYCQLFYGYLAFYTIDGDEITDWFAYIKLEGCIIKKKNSKLFEVRNPKGTTIFSENLSSKLRRYATNKALIRVTNAQELPKWIELLEKAIEKKTQSEEKLLEYLRMSRPVRRTQYLSKEEIEKYKKDAREKYEKQLEENKAFLHSSKDL